MRPGHSLALGLLISLIVAVTVLGAISLSLQPHSANLLAELPAPAGTLDFTFPSLTPTPTATSQPAGLTPAASLTSTSTATPTPTVCPFPVDWQRIVVGPFDTLSLLAQRFNVPLDQLARANCLPQLTVSVGQTIVVPPFRPTFTPIPCKTYYNWSVYIVQPGDTLSGIAARYNIPLYLLISANCGIGANIYPGQRLFVPWIYPIAPFTPTPIFVTFTPTPIVTLPSTATPTPPVQISPTPSETPPPITLTAQPSETPTSEPTATPTGAPTDIPTTTPTTELTATPAPTATPVPIATDTPVPALPTATPVPPTNTAVPPTSVPPTTQPPATAVEPTVVLTP